MVIIGHMSLKSTVGAKNTAQKLFIPKSFWRCRNFCPDRGGAGRGGAAPSFSGAGRGIVENWPGAAIFAGARVGHSEGESLCGGRKRDSEEMYILKMVTLGGARQAVWRVRITLLTRCALWADPIISLVGRRRHDISCGN